MLPAMSRFARVEFPRTTGNERALRPPDVRLLPATPLALNPDKNMRTIRVDVPLLPGENLPQDHLAIVRRAQDVVLERWPDFNFEPGA